MQSVSHEQTDMGFLLQQAAILIFAYVKANGGRVDRFDGVGFSILEDEPSHFVVEFLCKGAAPFSPQFWEAQPCADSPN